MHRVSGRTLCEDKGGDTSLNQGILRTACHQEQLGQSFPKSLGDSMWPCRHLDFRRAASRRGRNKYPRLEALQSEALCGDSPRTLVHAPALCLKHSLLRMTSFLDSFLLLGSLSLIHFYCISQAVRRVKGIGICSVLFNGIVFFFFLILQYFKWH